MVSLLFSASKGDVTALRRYVASGMDPMVVDYDMRSALHIAASGGKLRGDIRLCRVELGGVEDCC